MELFIFLITRVISLGCTVVIFREALEEVRGEPLNLSFRLNVKMIRARKELREVWYTCRWAGAQVPAGIPDVNENNVKNDV